MDAVIVGLDVAKNKLDVAIHPSGEAFVVERNGGGIDGLIDGLRAAKASIVGLEATGGYETVVAASLSAAGLSVVVVNRAQVRAFAWALGQRAKTDVIDARVIARYVEAAKPEVRPLPDADTRHLADLVSRRRQIVDMIGSESQRKKRCVNKRSLASIERLLLALEKELSDIGG
jgi:transposase